MSKSANDKNDLRKNSPLLELKGVFKVFSFPEEVTVLDNINLEAHPGESIALVGASGKGKSTLLHIAAGLEAPSKGSIEVLGKTLTPQNAAKMRSEHIGFIYQSFHLLDDLSLVDNVTLPLKIARRFDKEKSVKKAMSLLEKVGLSHRLQFPVKLLSGGEKQRAAIARALITEPDLVFADEPTGNLDVKASMKVFELLLACASKKRSVIIATHNLELAALCSRTFSLGSSLLPKASTRISV